MEVDLFDLERFVKAQNSYNSYNIALQEIKGGQKRSHWMWYIFPQIQGLGHSSTSQKYSIKSLLEAKAYLEHDTLGQRLYEVMKALPVFGDAIEIFGQLDAMKLRSCLTLFDLVSPDDIFSDFLGNYFDKERCQRTLKIVSSELSYYKDGDAFTRNGINERPRAFLEGIDGSDNLTRNNCIGTLLDLFERGETMRMLVSRHLWNKNDFSAYRVSCIKLQLQIYMKDLFQDIADSIHAEKTRTRIPLKMSDLIKNLFHNKAINTQDDTLFNEMNGLYSHYECAKDNQLFQIADAIDEFLNEHRNDMRVKQVIDSIIKDSLCKPKAENRERKYNGIVRPEYTPNAISSLKNDEIFVFGSNLQGYHGGGAARAAINKFGAVWGKGVGLQGQSYAIPTMQGGVDTIKPYVDQFIDFAKNHSELFFYVTRIGCGIAGFKDSDIAPLFKNAMATDNICLPKSFVDTQEEPAINKTSHAPKSYKIMMHGQCRTFADIVKTLNEQHHYQSFNELLTDFSGVIEQYQQRGVINQDSLDVMEKVLYCNKDTLFDDNGFHLERFIEKLESAFDDENKSDLDIIYANRQRTKLMILLKTLNDICHYKDVEDLRYDLLSIATGRFHCGDNSYMGDPLPSMGNYPINWFLSGLQEQWNNVTANGTLDNDLLELIMFTEHLKKVSKFGIDKVISNDFTVDSPCHSEVFNPKTPGTAPVYVKDELSRRYIKACGEGKGPRSGHELYEMQIVKPILWREVNHGNYELLEGRYYIPVGTVMKPIFIENYGRAHFASLTDKRKFISDLRNRAKGC